MIRVELFSGAVFRRTGEHLVYVVALSGGCGGLPSRCRGAFPVKENHDSAGAVLSTFDQHRESSVSRLRQGEQPPRPCMLISGIWLARRGMLANANTSGSFGTGGEDEEKAKQGDRAADVWRFCAAVP